MAKQTVEEVLNEIACKIGEDGKRSLNQFNRSKFTKLMNAAAADPDFTAQVAKIQKGEFTGYEEVACGKKFRKWVRNIVEKAGIDPAESSVVEGADFPIGDMDWIYDFFAEVLWLYLESNKFKLPSKEGFEATLALKDVDEVKKIGDVKKPGGEVIGRFETTKKAHKELTVKSKCPKWLQQRKQV